LLQKQALNINWRRVAVSDLTVGFKRLACPDCEGSGELRIESENINEHFEVEKQTVITECPRCLGLGFLPPGSS
jgi:DnaJ-class molecular chaperone